MIIVVDLDGCYTEVLLYHYEYFLYIWKFNNKQLGRKSIISLLVPNQLLLLLSLHLRYRCHGLQHSDNWKLLVQHACAGPLSSASTWLRNDALLSWSKTPGQIFTKESILLDLEVGDSHLLVKAIRCNVKTFVARFFLSYEKEL